MSKSKDHKIKMNNDSDALPPVFKERLLKIIPSAAQEGVLHSFRCLRPAAFRLHKPGVHAEDVEKGLTGSFDLRAIPELPGAFLIMREQVRALQETRLYREGAIYLQGLSSMSVAGVLDPQPGEKILDMAAAPGSKTTQIARLMHGEGELVANDVHRVRFYKLKAIVEAQGFGNVRLRLGRGEFLWKQMPEACDRVLLDAPCSSEGRLSLLEPESLRFWKLSKIKEMAQKQRGLILSAFGALKPGGLLVYSTCTLAPEENEVLLSWALRKFGEAAEVVPSAVPWPSLPGLGEWEGKPLHPSLVLARRILPDEKLESFFICSIRKRHSWTPKPVDPESRESDESKVRQRYRRNRG